MSNGSKKNPARQNKWTIKHKKYGFFSGFNSKFQMKFSHEISSAHFFLTLEHIEIFVVKLYKEKKILEPEKMCPVNIVMYERNYSKELYDSDWKYFRLSVLQKLDKIKRLTRRQKLFFPQIGGYYDFIFPKRKNKQPPGC
jgi:hypothetical protein